MRSAYDVVVVGAGAAGAACAFHAARRGASVLLLEQFGIPHDRGSSHGPSRIFRFAYDSVDYARMAVAARDAWRDLEREAGLSLLCETGGLDVGPGDSRGVRAVAASLAAVGAAHEVLDAVALARRFPQWRVPDDWAAVFSPDAGIVEPSRSVEVMAMLARAFGADVLEWTPVLGVDFSDGAAPVVRTGRGAVSCGALVVAAGAWLGELLPEFASRLTVTLESSVFFRPSDRDAFAPERFPVFIEHASNTYGFPVFGLPGVKLGVHHGGAATTASARSFEVPDAVVTGLRAFLERHLPGAAGAVMQARSCLYTNSPSEDFVIDRHPRSARVIVASPCSGHGFKFAPLTGAVLAGLALDGGHEFALERFRLHRALGT